MPTSEANPLNPEGNTEYSRAVKGISIADIQADNYRSSLRNKLVAEGFYLINAIEKYGSGFIRIRKALHEHKRPELIGAIDPLALRPRNDGNPWSH